MFARPIWTVLVGTCFAVISCAAPNGHGHGRHSDAPGDVHVGAIEAGDLLDKYPAFQASYRQYQPTADDRELAASLPDDIDIEIHFGTWCHDSQRELGRFIKLLQTRERRAHPRVSYLALTTDKRDTTGRAASLNVRFTPTFVVFRDGRELGRIVERPAVSLMADIHAMLAR